MTFPLGRIALAAAISLVCVPGIAGAFDDCPADHVYDGYTCTEKTGAGKNGGYFRVTFPSDWDGDLVIINHGFDLEDRKIRPHEVCADDPTKTEVCAEDADCTGSGNFCNNISYLGLDEILLPRNKAVAASTYASSGWAVFSSAKDLKDIISFVKKDDTYGDLLQRVIVTGFSLGGAVTADATLKLKIDGAVPLCGAVAGGLTTWDTAQDVRLIYDFLCDNAGGGAKFLSAPDIGENNALMSQTTMALKVDACFGVVGFTPHTPEMDTRLADFVELTQFSGYDGSLATPWINVATTMGFATLGLGDFVLDPERLDGKRIGLNEDPALDYSGLGGDTVLAGDFDAGVERLTKGRGRSKLKKASFPDFTKGKGAKVAYPILSMAGANDWLVIPEFERVYDTALTDGGKLVTQTWIDTFGHCVFSEQEVTAVMDTYFAWLGPVGGPYGAQPLPQDVEDACLALPGGIDGDTCNFNGTFTPGAIYDRVPPREDWPAAAKP